MNSFFKRATGAIRAAAMAFLMALALPVAAQTASTKFIPTFLLYHGGGPALVASDAAKLAKFDLIEIERLRYNNIGPNTWAAIKALNANAQVYLYQMGPEAPSHLDATAQVNLNGLGRHNVSRGHPQGALNTNNPGLFQLDASAKRIYNLFTSNSAASQYWYLMDFGSAAYQSYWVNAVKADIVNQPWAADGVFADNCLTSAGAGRYNQPSAWYSTNATWSAAMNSFAGAITAGLHGVGQKLWCNRGETSTLDGSAAWKTLDNAATPPDVLLEEGAFAVQWGNANTQFYTESEWKRQVDIMGAIKNSKVAMLSHTKLLEGQAGADNYGRPVTYWQSLWYSLGSFLLGKNDQLNNAHFMFSGGSGYSKIWWHEEYEKINLGKAIGPYAVRTIGSVNVYWREFEKGYVYVNPTPSNVASVSLPQASKRLTHDNLLSAPSSIANVTTIALNSHDAAILLKSDATAPSVPTGLTGTAVSATQINLTWNASTDNVGVMGYRVYVNNALVSTTSTTSFQHIGLTTGTTYNYSVSAHDAVFNHSARSAPVAVTTPGAIDTSAPSTPTGLSVSALTSASLTLSWSAATDNVAVTGYRVERCQGAGCVTFAQVGTPIGTSFSNLGLAAGTSYSYRVRATDSAGNVSGFSNVASATTSSAPPLTTGLVAAYGFNEGAGTTVADVSGNGNAGTISGASWTTTGKFGGALSFNGVNNLVQIPNSASLNLGAAMTLEAWIFPTTAQSGWRTIMSHEGDTYFLYASNGTGPPAGGGAFGGTVAWVSGTSANPVNAWTHVALTYDGARVRLYVNGVQAASMSRTGAIPTNANPLRIGGNITYGEFFQGYIDEVRVYNRALTQAEIQTAMNTAVGGTPPPPDTTVPTVPTGLSATAASASQINLAWSASTDNAGVTGYRIYRGGALITTLGNVTTFQNTGLSPSTTYAYTVRAIDAAGNASAQSAAASATTQASSDTTPPSVPAGLTVTVVSATQINLSWTTSTDNVAVTGYRLERCQGAGCVNFAQVGTPTGASFSNAGLAAGTTYRYRARAADAAGNFSGYSNVVSATTSSAPPPVGTATLTWDAVTAPNLSGYRAYYGTAPGSYVQPLGQGVNVGNVVAHVVTGLSRGTRYYFVMTAFNTSNNESIFSNEVSMVIP